MHKAILDAYKRRVRPLADSIASGSVRCNNKYIFSTCLKITSMVFMFIYIYALEKGKKIDNYINATKRPDSVANLFEELRAQKVDLRSFHQYRWQQHLSVPFQ